MDGAKVFHTGKQYCVVNMSPPLLAVYCIMNAQYIKFEIFAEFIFSLLLILLGPERGEAG